MPFLHAPLRIETANNVKSHSTGHVQPAAPDCKRKVAASPLRGIEHGRRPSDRQVLPAAPLGSVRQDQAAIDKAVSPEIDVHLVLDNHGTHKTAMIHSWLARHPQYHLHFTPASAE